MTKKDFEETLNRVLLEHFDDQLTPAELTKFKRDLVANLELDWEPFEDADPLDVAEDVESSDAPPEYESYSAEMDDEPQDSDDE